MADGLAMKQMELGELSMISFKGAQFPKEVILFAVFFWSFLWGISGAFIGVPIVIAILTVCEQHASTQWVANLLSGRDRAPLRTRSR